MRKDGVLIAEYTYYDNGNRKTLTHHSVGGAVTVTTYSYDFRNRLINESKVYGDTEEIFHYAYDFNGNLRQRKRERFSPAEKDGSGADKVSAVKFHTGNSTVCRFVKHIGQ